MIIDKDLTLTKIEDGDIDSDGRCVIPFGVTCIGTRAFADNELLKNIIIPRSVQIIDRLAFDICISLQSIKIPDSVTLIGAYAFCGCNSLNSVTIPDSVKQIGEAAFYACKSLKSVDLPETTKTGFCCFGDCNSEIEITKRPTKPAKGVYEEAIHTKFSHNENPGFNEPDEER